MGDVTVKYNNVVLTPTPYVQQSLQFVDYGSRWGNIQQVELNGYLPNVSGTGDLRGALLSLFTDNNFGKLEVFDGSTVLYSWNCLNIDEIAISNNSFFQNSFVPYTVRMRQYNLPSGVIEPVNEYSFAQNEDGTTTLNHKISARGIKINTNDGALDDAITFVRALTGRNAYAPVFMPSGVGVLMSLSETINRAECSYAVSETWKYNTGSNNTYVEWFSADISDTVDNEYLTVDTTLKIQGSPVFNNLSTLETTSALSSEDRIMSRMTSLGYQTGAFILNSMSISRNSGTASIDIKRSFLSGVNSGDLQGYFDYRVSCTEDLLLPKENWKLDGEFVCKGPLSYRRNRLAAFKATNQADWRTYLSGLLVSSPLWSSFHDTSTLTSSKSSVTITENTGMAIFQASFTLNDTACDTSVVNPKYSVEVTPPKWIYDLLPSANIEGHYVIQDLQMKSQGRISINVSADTIDPINALNTISGYVTDLEGIYVANGTVTSENTTTGILDASYSKEWLGTDILGSGLLSTKVVGSTLTNYQRAPGYRFGY